MYSFKPTKRVVLASWFPLHSNIAWWMVSGASSLHLVHRGVCLGRILATLSAVGSIWCRSLNMKVVRSGPRFFILASCQVLSQLLVVLVSSTLRGCSVRGPLSWSASSTIVISSTKKWYISFMLINIERSQSSNSREEVPTEIYGGMAGCMTGTCSTYNWCLVVLVLLET